VLATALQGRMEDLLNAVWLMLVLTAGWVWLRHWRGFSRYSLFLQLWALACGLIILFPVVSANDDLYLQRNAIETSEKQKSATVVCASQAVRPCSHARAAWSALPQTPFTALGHVVLSLAATDPISLLVAKTSFLPFLNRPPPRLFLA
jgi:hypothetical protein